VNARNQPRKQLLSPHCAQRVDRESRHTEPAGRSRLVESSARRCDEARESCTISGIMGTPATAFGPLTAAAAEFERELARYEKIGAELARTKVQSQKTLARTQKLLTESAECEESLGQRLRALLEAMNGARDKQQTSMEQTLTAAKDLEARATEFAALMERVAALGSRARDTSEPAVQALAESKQGDQGGALLRSLETLGERMQTIIRDAEEIARDADANDWPEVARDVQSLKQQVISAHGKLVQATSAAGPRILS
jgi:chromosome segregation ATPase